MTPVIVPATMEHALSIAERMRKEDAEECWAIFQLEPGEAMQKCLNDSTLAWTWLVDGEPACMFGYASHSMVSDVVMPWLMTTDLVGLHSLTFLRYSRPMINVMLERGGRLENYVDARYKSCIRWLKWLGFTLYPAKPFGVLGMPFYRFEMERSL